MRIALIPLDERPVNTGLVKDVAAIAGAECLIPDRTLLPAFRAPGDTAGVAHWLKDVAPSVDGIVVSLDTLVHGGLIPARTTEDTVEDCVARLGVLRELRESFPALPIYAVSLVTRASDAYNNVEEPIYWADYGRDLHRLGGDSHRAWLAHEASPTTRAPEEVREDFVRRRLRNHILNLTSLRLRWDGILDYLTLTADDTAEFSAGSAEQYWFEYWRTIGGRTLPVIGYPGADETGAVLMARALLADSGPRPIVRVLCGEAAALDRIPPYENGPIRLSVQRQITAAGGECMLDEEHLTEVSSGDRADMILVLHGPDPERGDHGGAEAPVDDLEAASATADLVESALATSRPVVVADVRYGNGGDRTLADLLAKRGVLGDLSAYGGWNTAGNALGGAVASGLAVVAGLRGGTLDKRAQGEALRRRLLDDVSYQTTVRRELMTSGPFEGSYGPVPDDKVAQAEVLAVKGMAADLELWNLDDGYSLQAVRFPWRRSFEVDLQIV